MLLRMSRLSQPVRLRQVNASVAVAVLLTANARNAKPKSAGKENALMFQNSSDLGIDSPAGFWYALKLT